MSLFSHRRDDDRDQDRKPDPRKAQIDLERIRAQRARVEALVDEMARERHLNNFTANVVVSYQERRRHA